MGRVFEAKIRWLTEAEGGRKELPFGEKYAPIIQITKPLSISDEYWSVFVLNKTMLKGNETISTLRYLSDSAPDNLTPEVEFSLYEGPKLVAEGILLQEI